MNGEYLVHIREPMTASQRAALESRFPAGRRAAKPQFLFLGCTERCRPRDMVDFAHSLGLRARLVEI